MRTTTGGTFEIIAALPGALLTPIQEFQQDVEDALAGPLFPEINSAHITVPTVTAADIGGWVINTNITANNFSGYGFANASEDAQVFIGAQHIGSGATAGGHAVIATRPAGGSTFLEGLRVTSDQHVGIGTINPASARCVISNNASTAPLFLNTALEEWALHVVMEDGVPGGIGIDSFGLDINGNSTFPLLDFRRSRGTAASPTEVKGPTSPGAGDEDFLGIIGFFGYDGNTNPLKGGYSGGACQIRAVVDGDFSDISHPTSFVFRTTPVNASVSGESFRINGDGVIFNTLAATVLHAVTVTEVGRINANGLGLGMSPTNIIDVTQTRDNTAVIKVLNASSGTAAQALLQATSDSADTTLNSHSTGRTATRYGVTVGGFSELRAVAGNGLLIGTNTTNTPIVIGQNSIEVARFFGGNLGVGTGNTAGVGNTISARIHSLSTTEQLRLGYDTSNYAGFTVSSAGVLTIAATGGSIILLKSQDSAASIAVNNTNAGTSSTALLRATSDLADTTLVSHSTGRVATRYGVTLGGYSEFRSVAGSGLLIGTDANATPIIIGRNSLPVIRIESDITATPEGDWIFNTGGKDILPATNYDQNLGALNKKYLTLHASELWVETLVAQNTIATIGGRILVGPTTVLTSDLAAAATSIIVKHQHRTV